MLEGLKARVDQYNIVKRGLLLAIVYALFWLVVHHTLTDAKFELEWILPQLL